VYLPSPTGFIRVNYICPGWDERQFDPEYDAKPDPADGAIDLYMTLDSGGIGRVLWGTAGDCRYLIPNDGTNCEANGCSRASFDGGIALDLSDIDWVSEGLVELVITFIFEGSIGFEGRDFPLNQSFRQTDVGLEILVDIGEAPLEETFNYFFAGTGEQFIRDAGGFFGCSLQERRCFDESGTLFSW
jgi:hypothetical protein